MKSIFKNLSFATRSFLKKTAIIFDPYDALDLLASLELRVEKALDTGKVKEGALQKIAAYASRETRDARKAVELLAKAVKIAEETSGLLSEKEVDIAEQSLEVDKTEELIKSLAKQQQRSLIACYSSLTKGAKKLSTGQVYDIYRALCDQEGIHALSQRRFSDMISFLDLYGLINARVISKGRYGKTREVSGSLPEKVIDNLLRERIW